MSHYSCPDPSHTRQYLEMAGQCVLGERIADVLTIAVEAVGVECGAAVAAACVGANGVVAHLVTLVHTFSALILIWNMHIHARLSAKHSVLTSAGPSISVECLSCIASTLPGSWSVDTPLSTRGVPHTTLQTLVDVCKSQTLQVLLSLTQFPSSYHHI